MEYLFNTIWDIMLMLLGTINTLVGYLLDIQFLGIPILVFLVFFDLFLHLMSFFGNEVEGDL